MNEALPGADNANNEAVVLENPRILQSLTALRSSLHSHRRYRLFKTFTSRLSVFFFPQEVCHFDVPCSSYWHGEEHIGFSRRRWPGLVCVGPSLFE